MLEMWGVFLALDLSNAHLLQLAVPHSEDWTHFGHTLMEIRANRGDGEEEGPGELSA